MLLCLHLTSFGSRVIVNSLWKSSLHIMFCSYIAYPIYVMWFNRCRTSLKIYELNPEPAFHSKSNTAQIKLLVSLNPVAILPTCTNILIWEDVLAFMCAKEKIACVSSLHGNTLALQSMSTLDPLQQMTGYYKLFQPFWTSMHVCIYGWCAISMFPKWKSI